MPTLRVMMSKGEFAATAAEGVPLTVGRGPGNQVVLTDPHVSWHHVVMWTEDNQAWVKDLSSSNGTFVNGAQVQGQASLKDGDMVRLGMSAVLRVSLEEDAPESKAPRPLVLEDMLTGARAGLMRGRHFKLGSGRECDIHLPDAPPWAATLMLHSDGGASLGVDDEELELEVTVPFELAGRKLRLIRVPASRVPTARAGELTYRYRVSATLNGRTGPQARIFDHERDLTHEVTAANRAILLYVLGRALTEDREAGLPVSDQGWRDDAHMIRAIWGKLADPKDAGGLHVLVFRLRTELRKAGLDPWFIEKRRKRLRLRVANIELP